MKKLAFFLLLGVSALALASCGEDKEIIVDPTQPDGSFSAQRSGALVAQNGTPTQGAADLGTDEAGEQFIRFSSDFMTELGTGTVTLYLSKSMDFVADPPNGSPSLQIVSLISKNGAQFHKVDSPVGSDYTHLIVWCGSASIPFGYAPLN